jgi:hypothetical protein
VNVRVFRKLHPLSRRLRDLEHEPAALGDELE